MKDKTLKNESPSANMAGETVGSAIVGTSEKKGQRQATGVTKTTEQSISLLCDALQKVYDNGGEFLNANGKLGAAYFQKEYLNVSPINKLLLALYSDSHEYKTNQFMTFADAHKSTYSVKGGQHGMPINWYFWDKCISKEDTSSSITRKEYESLPADEKKKWDIQQEKKVIFVFNVDQTSLSSVDSQKYSQLIGRVGERNARIDDPVLGDKKDRMAINEFMKAIQQNLVKIRKDAPGLSYYDPKKDTIHLPLQSAFSSYPEYVQAAMRQIVTSTGHSQRLSREGMDMQDKRLINTRQTSYERLVVELASAIKQVDYGFPAKISPESIPFIPQWIDMLHKDSSVLKNLERDVNMSVSMIGKAAKGEQIAKNSEKMLEKLRTNEQQVQNQFSAVERFWVDRDDSGQYFMYIKPENSTAFIINPSETDVSLYFDVIRTKTDDIKQQLYTQLANKYANLLSKGEVQSVDPFYSDVEGKQFIDKAFIFKDKENKIMLSAFSDGQRLPLREVDIKYWYRLFYAPDKDSYKLGLACVLHSDLIKSKMDQKEANKETKEKEQEEKRNSPEKKTKDNQEERPKTKEKIELTPMMKKFLNLKEKHPDALLLFRCGDFYETYMQDAEKASKVLGITLTKSSKSKDPEGKPLAMAGFPYHALDAYLPRLIRAGHRVAICDTIEEQKLTKKRSITELVNPSMDQKEANKETKEKDQEEKKNSPEKKEKDNQEEKPKTKETSTPKQEKPRVKKTSKESAFIQEAEKDKAKLNKDLSSAVLALPAILAKYGNNGRISVRPGMGWNSEIHGFTLGSKDKSRIFVDVYWQGDSTDGNESVILKDVYDKVKNGRDYIIPAESMFDGYRTREIHSDVRIDQEDLYNAVKKVTITIDKAIEVEKAKIESAKAETKATPEQGEYESRPLDENLELIEPEDDEQENQISFHR